MYPKLIVLLNDEDSAHRPESPINDVFQVQIACNCRHLVVYVFRCYKDSLHDITILRESGILEYTEENVQIIADRDYIGKQYLIIPKKKPSGRELTSKNCTFIFCS